MKLACDPASNRPKPCKSLKNGPRILPVRRSLLALVGRKHIVARDHLFPQKPPGSRLGFSRPRVPHLSGSSTIELPSALAESGSSAPNTTCHGTLRVLRRSTRLSTIVPPAFRVPPPREGHQVGAWEEAHRVDTNINQPNGRRVSTDRLNRVESQLVYLLRVSPALHPTERPSNNEPGLGVHLFQRQPAHSLHQG